MQPIVGGAAQNLDVEIFWIRLEFVSVVSRLKSLDVKIFWMRLEFVSVVSRLKNLDDELESY
jgi:hypothetical protein